MRDLTPVRLDGAGVLLVLRDDSGAEYVVPLTSVHETLEPANRRAPTMESSLRPRDIQSRIRAGESAEEVAAVAGTSVEKVMIFASPVLAERAHIAQSAQSASVRRASGDPTSPAVATCRTLGAAVECRLREQGVDPAGLAWDSWRREDGRWTLQATYGEGGVEHAARFSFDQRGHFVAADDDEARWLVGDGQVPARSARPAPETAPAATPDERPGLRLAPAYSESTATPARAAGSRRSRARADDIGDDTLDLFTADADWMGSLDQTGSARQDTTRVAPEERAPSAPVAEAPAPVRAQERPPTERTAARQSAKKGRGRASVPSWDEIMFGGGGK